MKIVPYVVLFDTDVDRKLAEEFYGQVIDVEQWDSINDYVRSRIPKGTEYDLYDMDEFQDEFNYECFNSFQLWLGYFFVKFPNNVA